MRSLQNILAAARTAADLGARATIPLVATKGRASYLGERSAGHQDPGATSAALLLGALADASASSELGLGGSWVSLGRAQRSAEVVEVWDVDRQVATGDLVLVGVRAASVNRADLDGLDPRWQFTRLFLGLRRPRSRRLGLDVAGVVESVGPTVTRFQPGDRVFATSSHSGRARSPST